MARLSPRTVVLRERVLAMLREADRPMSTPEISLTLTRDGSDCDSPRAIDRKCDAAAVGYWPCRGWCWRDVYPQLRALRSLGLVRLEPNVGGRRVAWWSFVAVDSDEYFNQVLAGAYDD